MVENISQIFTWVDLKAWSLGGYGWSHGKLLKRSMRKPEHSASHGATVSTSCQPSSSHEPHQTRLACGTDSGACQHFERFQVKGVMSSLLCCNMLNFSLKTILGDITVLPDRIVGRCSQNCITWQQTSSHEELCHRVGDEDESSTSAFGQRLQQSTAQVFCLSPILTREAKNSALLFASSSS